jgi:hypothetical protein
VNVQHALLRRVRNKVSVERDLWSWGRELAPLRAAQRPPVTRHALFCNLMSMPATAKVESLIAGLLRLKGYGAVVLLEGPNPTIERIFRAAVPDAEILHLGAAIDDEARAAAERAAHAIMDRCPDLQSLVRLEVDGFRLGRNVQSLVLRQFRVGRLDDADPRHRDAAVETLARSLATKQFMQRLLAGRRLDIAVFVERGYTPSGEVFDGCLLGGVDTIQWCGAPQSDCLIYRRYGLDTRGEHPLALSDVMWRRLDDMPWSAQEDQAVADRIAANYKSGAWYNRQQLQDGKTILAADEVRRTLGLDPSRRTAVVFSHILYDATFFYGDNLFDDYEQWLVETVRAAIANPRLDWIVKVHPVNVWRARMDGAEPAQLEAQTLARHFGALPDHVKLMPADTPVNTFSLFDVADYGLTVRGTIGMELPCFGIPVVTAGTGRYSGRGFTIEPTSRADYTGVLARLHDVPRLDAEAVRRARRHYYGALNLRPVPMQSFMFDYHADKIRGAASPYDVVLQRRADETLLESEDLGRLVKWITETREPELLTRDIERDACSSGGR